MRLGIDLDGVVADFNAGWIRLHREEFGSDLQPSMVTTWDGLHTLAGFPDMDMFWSWARENGDRPSIFRHFDPYPDAVETLEALEGMGHDIVIITAKPDWAIPDTFRWLADHGVPTREVHMQDQKYLVECDVYLDDSPHVVPELVAHRPGSLVCRFVRPWNDVVDGSRSVHSWGAFHDAVTEWSQS
jgi:5'(3')-deoxyribonucleotidase